MAGGVSGYAAINARVRVMYSALLTADELRGLSQATDLAGLVGALKRSAYGPYVDALKENDLTARGVAFQIRSRLADAFQSVVRTSPGQARPVLARLYRYYEVNNLKAVLRGIVTSASWERVRSALFPYGSMTVLPAEAMVELRNVAGAVELLRGTPYYEVLSFAMRRYSAEQSLFPLEVALDLNYWRQLWQAARQLLGEDQQQALRVVGSLVDMNNLMWAIRYRVYHQLSEEELINYTLPFGYRVHDEDIRAVAAGADISTVVARVYPGVGDASALLEEPRTGLPRLELTLKRHVMTQCFGEFVGSPFHIGIPLAYLVLSDLEMQDLIVLIEAKAAQLPEEEFQPFLVRAPAVRV